MKTGGLHWIMLGSLIFLSGCAELVFTRGHESAATAQIYRMRADGTQVINISQSAFSSAHPDVSPGGDLVAFSSGVVNDASVGNIYVMPVSGGERSPLTAGAYQKFYPRWGLNDYENKMVYTRLSSGNPSRIMIIDTTGASNLLTNPGPEYSDMTADIYYSPRDGRYKVIFSRMHIPTQRKRLFFINADGTGEAGMMTKDLHDNEEMPVVSHDGRFVAYRAYRYAANDFFEAVRVMTVDDWRPVSEIRLQIPEQMTIRGIGWSRSDRRLYVSMEISDVTGVQFTEDRAEIFSMKLDGTDRKQLTRNSVPDFWPNGIPCRPGFWRFVCALVDEMSGE